MLPQRIGRYDVSAELGRGSTSIVYKGVDPADGRIVAIKTLQRNGADSDADTDAILLRFRSEARTIGRLRHPGVVGVDEFGEDGLHTWIAMEYVEGRDLEELLLRNPLLGEQRSLAIMDELLDALGCVHREGICHRDLKPANILVTTAGHVKLTDFGVARLRDLGLTRVSSIIGTPAFMAPEQFTGRALDHRADLFGCGVLLFLLLGGRRPFTGAPASVMHQILHEEPPLLSEASGGLVGRAYDDVVARALAKQADARFASAEEMREALRVAASRAAESPLPTIVRTLVQEAGRPHARAPGGDAPVDPSRVPPGEPMPRVSYRDGHAQVQLVDALALYSLDGEPPDAVDDHSPDADDTRALRAPGDDALPPDACANVQHLLARRLGPIAGVLVKRAADAAGGSRSAFIASLLAQTPAPERAAWHAELEALLAAPQRAESGR